VQEEACPLQLAPTSSTIATLVMGDALSVALMKLRCFQDRDFAQFHPGGSLGRRLLTKAEDVMHSEKLPISSLDSSIKDIIQIISEGKMGLAIVMNSSKILGIITDGDIRRAMESMEEQFFSLKARDLMSKNPKIVDIKSKLTVVQKIMTDYKVNSLLVCKDEKLLGVIQIYDIGI
jgi:arabinose-5-phosphate isomerase